nr:hypothetical protein [Bacteroides fragilis]
MNKTILLVLAFVFAGITSVMANTSKDEKAEVSSVDKKLLQSIIWRLAARVVPEFFLRLN